MGFKAQEHLERQRFEVFNPRVIVPGPVIRGKQRASTTKQWLPGYIFVRFDIEENEYWPRVNSTMGVHRLLPYTMERPSPVRQSAMDILIETCVAENPVPLAVADEALLEVGTKAKAKSGPFTGLVGTVKWSMNDRVCLLMTLFGKETPLTLMRRDVEAQNVSSASCKSKVH